MLPGGGMGWGRGAAEQDRGLRGLGGGLRGLGGVGLGLAEGGGALVGVEVGAEGVAEL